MPTRAVTCKKRGGENAFRRSVHTECFVPFIDTGAYFVLMFIPVTGSVIRSNLSSEKNLYALLTP